MAKYRPSAEVRDSRLLIDGEVQPLEGFMPLHVLGQGANGVVVLAQDLSLNREVAVKVWTRQNRRANQGIAEAAKLARFHHPLIGAVWAFHPESPKPWAVLELVHGQTVAEWLEQPRPWENRFVVWALFVAALRHIHEAGSVHGDPHTKNLILTPDLMGHMSFFVPQPFAQMAFGFGLKVLDAGASILWNHPNKLVARESSVILETFERLFQMPELLGLIDELSPQPSARLMELDASARFQACLQVLAAADEDMKKAEKADDEEGFEAARRRWRSARSLALDTICQARIFNLPRVFEHMMSYPVYKKRLLVAAMARRLGFDCLLHNEDDQIPTNSIDILQARYKGLPDITWSW
jgi:serine/threonine protein kinase